MRNQAKIKGIEKNLYEMVLEEVEQALPYSYPNPAVGCVVVKEGVILGRGHTQPYPSKHAERMAIESVSDKSRLRGATLYTSLMPCCHVGKNPPCLDLILECGIKEVIVALEDPFPLVYQNSRRIFEEKGIPLRFEFPASIVRAIFLHNETFFMRYLYTERPFITLKYAMTLDGKMADGFGGSKWITSEEARKDVHFHRALYDGIWVGEKTVRLDNPQLNVRHYDKVYQPTVICFNGSKAFPPETNLFKNPQKTIFLVNEEMPKTYVESLRQLGKTVIPVKKGENLSPLLRRLKQEEQIGSVYVEGGSSLHALFYEQGFWDKIQVYVAPRILGDGLRGLSPFSNSHLPAKTMEEALDLQSVQVRVLGKDVVIEGYSSGFSLDSLLDRFSR